MASIAFQAPDLNQAVQIANAALEKQGDPKIQARAPKNQKDPVFLSRVDTQTGQEKEIGIIHMVRLVGENWDATPFEALAKSTEEVAQAILARVRLFNESVQKGLYINERGMIFDFGAFKVEVKEDGAFSIDSVPVKYNNKPLPLRVIAGEGVIKFTRVQGTEEKGLILLDDGIDKRVGKGMFIHPLTGELTRG